MTDPICTFYVGLNPLPNDKILDRTELKETADDILNIAKLMIFVSGKVENIERKGENAGY